MDWFLHEYHTGPPKEEIFWRDGNHQSGVNWAVEGGRMALWIYRNTCRHVRWHIVYVLAAMACKGGVPTERGAYGNEMLALQQVIREFYRKQTEVSEKKVLKNITPEVAKYTLKSTPLPGKIADEIASSWKAALAKEQDAIKKMLEKQAFGPPTNVPNIGQQKLPKPWPDIYKKYAKMINTCVEKEAKAIVAKSTQE